MSRERIVDSLRTRARLVTGRGGLLPALATAAVVLALSWVGVRKWCLARQALCSPAQGAEDETASRVALRAYQAGDAASPLVADRWAPRVASQVGVASQVATLRRVPNAIVLEPAQSGATPSREPALTPAAPDVHRWLAAGRGPQHAPLWASGPRLPTPPELVMPANQDASILTPSQGNHGIPPHRSWDVSRGPSVEPTPISPADAPEAREIPQVNGPTAQEAPGLSADHVQDTGTFHTPADDLRAAAEATARGAQETLPVERPGAAQAPRSTLIDEIYAREIGRLLKPIGQVSTTVAPPPGQFHPDVADKDERPRLPRGSELFSQQPAQFHGAGGIRTRPWPELIALWEAPGTAHHPLYFEEVNLERYGYSFGLAQPVVSAAHFFGRIPALPYLMTVDPPHRCVYTLGHYRPGSCAPLAWNLVPFDPLAAAVQGGVVTGLVYLIP